MKFPCLILPQFCKTPIKVTIYGEAQTEDGAPVIVLDGAEFKCNFQDKAKTVYNAQQKIVQVNGTCYIPSDISPNTVSISGGFVEVFGEKRSIAQGVKARNADGTVNYTQLDVI